MVQEISDRGTYELGRRSRGSHCDFDLQRRPLKQLHFGFVLGSLPIGKASWGQRQLVKPR